MIKPDQISRSQQMSMAQTSRIYDDGARTTLFEESPDQTLILPHTKGGSIDQGTQRPTSAHLLPTIPESKVNHNIKIDNRNNL
jgi:hypothetical protein